MTTTPVSDRGAEPRRAILGQLPRMYRADGSPIRVLLVDDERALTNLVGNAVATIVVAKWENALDMARLQRHLTRANDIEMESPEKALA